MKKYTMIALLTLMSGHFTLVQGNSTAGQYSATTYNVTHANKNNGKQRESGNIEVIKKLNSDLLCLQEVIEDKNQLKSIQDALPGYGWVGDKRNAHIKGASIWLRLATNFPFFHAQDEYCPIFYNKQKFELINAETFGINTPDSYLPRIAVIACLKEIASGKELCVCNTHLDHKYENVRTEQAQLIARKLTQKCGDRPIILMGDFNTTFDKDMKKVLTQDGFTHAKTKARVVEGADFTHEKGSTKKLIECDHIFIKPEDKFTVKQYETFETMSPTTSDHNPVKMTFSLNE
jgi:endonuclease/exonuclease/phosphatase family metal-dependent hydrolase